MMMQFREWLGALLVRLAGWVLPTPVVAPHPLAEVMTTLVSQAEVAWPETSGEFKRHQVYAEALKRFPEERPRDLALLLELAVQKVKP